MDDDDRPAQPRAAPAWGAADGVPALRTGTALAATQPVRTERGLGILSDTPADQALLWLRRGRYDATHRGRAARELVTGYLTRHEGWGSRFAGLDSDQAGAVFLDTVERFLDKCPDDCVWPERWFFVAFRNAARSLARQVRREAARLEPLEGDPDRQDQLAPIDRLAADAESSDPLHRWMEGERWEIAREMLHQAMARSPKRQAVVRMYIQGKTYPQIAQSQGMSQGAVRDMIHRVLRLARQLYEDSER